MFIWFRFCGVSNSFVKRNAEGAAGANTAPQAKDAGVLGQAVGSSAKQTGSILQPQKEKSEQAISKSAFQSSSVTASSTKTDRSIPCDVQTKESDKDNSSLPIKKKGQSDKSSAGTGSSLANLWGRASSKPKSTICDVKEKVAVSKTNG